MRALVLEPGGARNALAAARGLGRAGWTVGIGSPEEDFVSASRWSRHWHHVPSPWQGPDRFIESTNDAVRARGYEVVFGAGDAEVLALSARRERLDARIPYASHEHVLRAFDKVELAKAAWSVGLQTPRFMDPTDSVHRAGADVVVKPRMNEVSAPQIATIESGGEQTARRISELVEAGAEPIVQERVPGRLMAYTVLADHGSHIVARVQQEAETIWPPGAGISARARTVAVDEEHAAKAARLVAELGWFGLVELQFLVPASDAPVLIDFNGRFYGSMALALAAGVNFPALWASLATGRGLPPSHEAVIGVRYQWLEGDLRRARAERRGGLLRDLAGCIRYAGGAAHSVWSASDPAPALKRTWEISSSSARFRCRAAWRRVRKPR